MSNFTGSIETSRRSPVQGPPDEVCELEISGIKAKLYLPVNGVGFGEREIWEAARWLSEKGSIIGDRGLSDTRMYYSIVHELQTNWNGKLRPTDGFRFHYLVRPLDFELVVILYHGMVYGLVGSWVGKRDTNIKLIWETGNDSGGSGEKIQGRTEPGSHDKDMVRD